MKKMIFTIAILLSIAAISNAQNVNKIDCIKITHIGESDKPIKTLIITLVKGWTLKTDGFESLILTDNKTFKTTVSFILQKKINKNTSTKQFYEYGSFNISLFDKHTLITGYNIKLREESKQYFKKLISILTEKKSDEKLIDELNYVVKRIDY